MDINAITAAVMQQLINAVADEVMTRINANGAAHLALNSDAFREAVRDIFENDSTARESVRDIVSDSLDSYDLDDNRQFTSLSERVDTLEERDITFDADDDQFSDAVCTVIRNHI